MPHKSPEELAASKRERQRERAARWWAKRSPEERQAHLDRMNEYRRTPEWRARESERYAQSRAAQTPEEREGKKKRKKELYYGRTPERLARDKATAALYLARPEIKAKNAAQARARRARLTPEQRAAQRIKKQEYDRLRRARKRGSLL